MGSTLELRDTMNLIRRYCSGLPGRDADLQSKRLRKFRTASVDYCRKGGTQNYRVQSCIAERLRTWLRRMPRSRFVPAIQHRTVRPWRAAVDPLELRPAAETRVFDVRLTYEQVL